MKVAPVFGSIVTFISLWAIQARADGWMSERGGICVSRTQSSSSPYARGIKDSSPILMVSRTEEIDLDATRRSLARRAGHSRSDSGAGNPFHDIFGQAWDRPSSSHSTSSSSSSSASSSNNFRRGGHSSSSSSSGSDSDSPFHNIFGKVWGKSPSSSSAGSSSPGRSSTSSSPGGKIDPNKPFKTGGHTPSPVSSPDLPRSKNVPPAHRKRPPPIEIPGKTKPSPTPAAPRKKLHEFLNMKDPGPKKAPGATTAQAHSSQPPNRPPPKKPFHNLNMDGTPGSPPPLKRPSSGRFPNLRATPGSPAPKPWSPSKESTGSKIKGGVKSSAKAVSTGAKKTVSAVSTGAKKTVSAVSKGASKVKSGIKKLFNKRSSGSEQQQDHPSGSERRPAPGGGYFMRHTQPAGSPRFPRGPQFFRSKSTVGMPPGRPFDPNESSTSGLRRQASVSVTHQQPSPSSSPESKTETQHPSPPPQAQAQPKKKSFMKKVKGFFSKRDRSGVEQIPAPGGGYYMRHTKAAEKPIFPNGPKFFKTNPVKPLKLPENRPASPKLWEHLREPNPAKAPPPKSNRPAPAPAAAAPPPVAQKKGLMSKLKGGFKKFFNKREIAFGPDW